MLMGRSAHLGKDLDSANPHTNLRQDHNRESRRGRFEGFKVSGIVKVSELWIKVNVNFLLKSKRNGAIQQLYKLIPQKSIKLHSCQTRICDYSSSPDIKCKPNDQHPYL